MDSFLRQQTWMARARNAWPSEWNGHDLLYPQGQGTKGKDKECHVWPHHLFNQAQEIEQPNRTRLQGTLPIQRRHANRQPTYHQVTHQQRDLYTRGKILHNGHQKFLPMHAHHEV
jgi:hypothetical protein